jgi:hypothetical protein
MGEVKMLKMYSTRIVRCVARRAASTGLTLAAMLVAAPRAARTQVAPTVQQSANDIQGVINATYEKYKTLREGKNADYIPVLAKVDPSIFGIVLITPDGKVYAAGDTSSRVQLDLSDRGAQGQRHELVRERRRDRDDQHDQRRDPRPGLDQDHHHL